MFFWTQSLLMHKVIKNKSYLELVTNPFRLRNKFTKILLVIYCLTKFDGVMKSSSLVIPKTTFANLCKPFMTSWIIQFPFVLSNLESVDRKRKNCKNFIMSRTKRPFQLKWKKFFTVFEGYHLVKKKSIENSRHKL